MRIALAQLNPIVGNIAANAQQVSEAIESARTAGADLVVTPEMALSGYPPRDLLWREGVVKSCENAVEQLAGRCRDIALIIGHPRLAAGGVKSLRNSASICTEGKISAVYDKRLLPSYDVFYEDRYFAPGERTCVVDIAGRRVGVLICEDLWEGGDARSRRQYAAHPVLETVQAGCDLLISINATPVVAGKYHKHLRQLHELASKHALPIVMVNQVGANDDVIFDGGSVVIGPASSNSQQIQPLLALPRWLSAIESVDVTQPPPTHLDQQLQWDQQEEIFQTLVLGVRDYCRKTGHERVVLGLSGGVDSALTAVIAVAALGSENVLGVMMPSRYSSTGSIDDAESLARNLDIHDNKTLPIGPAHDLLRNMLEQQLGERVAGVPDENIQSRLRGLIVMGVSNAVGGLVLSTGNKSELAVGYCTLYGDMNGALAVLGDISKTQVYELAKWINDNHHDCGFRSPPIPEVSITKPPSAELKADQTDQDTLPAYDILDPIIQRYVEWEQSIDTIAEDTGTDRELVARFARLIDTNEYKRNQAPIVLKVTPRTFGPGRRMPIAMRE